MSRFGKSTVSTDLPEAERPAFQPPEKPASPEPAVVEQAKPPEPVSPERKAQNEAALAAVVGPDLGARFAGAQADKALVQTAGENTRAEKLLAFYEAFSELDVKTIRHISQSIGKMGNKRLCAWSKVLVAHDEAFGVIDKI